MGFHRASPTMEKVITEVAAPDSPSVAPPPISEAYVARRQTEAERKAYLESDKQVETVEEGRVRCRKCQTWIVLSGKQAYSTGQWVKHKSRCSDVVYVYLVYCVSCSFTHSLIGQAIALQRLGGNYLLSMIPKPNRSMRAELNAHSVARILHSKGKVITI